MDATVNGHDTAAEISFGPEPWQVIRREVASKMLTLIREDDPARWGQYLALAMTGTPPNRPRKPRNQARP